MMRKEEKKSTLFNDFPHIIFGILIPEKVPGVSYTPSPQYTHINKTAVMLYEIDSIGTTGTGSI